MNRLSHNELVESLSETYVSHYRHYPDQFLQDSFLTSYYTGGGLNESFLSQLEVSDEPLCHLGDYWPHDR